jgi:hypothetical protein
VQQLLIWLHILNGLLINTEKTTAMLFHTRQIKSFLNPKIIFEGMDIKCKYETFLGLYLIEDIKWDVYIKNFSY